MRTFSSRLALACAVIVGGVGVSVFLGWVFEIHGLKTIYGPITMKTNPAVAFVCCGIALYLSTARRGSRVAGALAATAAVIGGLTLLQHVFGWDLGIDQLLFTEAPGAAATASPNRMGPHASTSFVLAGTALLLLRGDRDASTRLAQGLAFAGAASGLVAVTGYMYGAVELYGIARYTGIALHTALTLLVLHVGILAARAEHGTMATFMDEGPAGTLLRRLTVPMIALPIGLGYLFMRGRDAEIFDRGLGTSLFAVSTIVVLFAVLWRTAAAIQASDRSRREAYESAERASRLKDQFIAVLSHELRTPLNVMLGRLRLLEDERDPEMRMRNATVIVRNGQLLARLVEDLLDLSRATVGQFEIAREPTDLNAVVRTAIDAISGEASKRGIRISGDLSEQVGALRADAHRLQQVMTNLLSNAVKFTPPGGTVAVTSARSGAKVTVTVVDTGVGFDPRFEPHLFEPFRQADQSARREHGGLGLGLSIARHLVELHGGTIRASSPGVGRGATFTIELPAGVGPDTPSAATVAQQEAHGSVALS